MVPPEDDALVGVDVGSTTVKIAVLDPHTHRMMYSRYKRHNADPGEVVLESLREAHRAVPNRRFITTFCGSSGQPFADITQGFFIQEVVANTLAIKTFYPEVRSAVELGGQDAKVIFFEYDEQRGQLTSSDMRMNGSCAGGTGAFLDQISELLHITPEEFNGYADRGDTLYDISGRCGVFAKTDISPLLNQGVSKENIALSSFHALAKQTIGGLAQGLSFRPKVIFEGGPLTFNPRLVSVFIQRLGLTADQVVIPEKPELIVACGAALAPLSMFQDSFSGYRRDVALEALRNRKRSSIEKDSIAPLFRDEQERRDFQDRHSVLGLSDIPMEKQEPREVWIGIDAGSTTAKFVVIDEEDEIRESYYASNRGEPLEIVVDGLRELSRRWKRKGWAPRIRGLGTTGYGEQLFFKAFHADHHCVETVAHARAARHYVPDASFILDIGGQDMKAISLTEGVVSGIVLNEACSAGCGSFLETYARSLNIPVQEIAEKAFSAKNPAKLGSRCTVFMNSAIVTEQKSGRTPSDIIAGLCLSIIENVFTKVVRMSNFAQLGHKIVVQGGTFQNDAVLRALELYIGREVVRSPYPGLMGALGVALLTKEHHHDSQESHFIGFRALERFSYTKTPGQTCPFCPNHCSRTVVTFADGESYVTGNRCERGEILGDPKDRDVRRRLAETKEQIDRISDIMTFQAEDAFRLRDVPLVASSQPKVIGIPRTLEFYSSAVFWSVLFRALGFQVRFSDSSTYRMFETALPFVPSDTVCFPAKLAHGHIESLVRKGVNRIFFPQMIQSPKENPGEHGNFYCAILQGYALVAEKSHDLEDREGIPLDHPIFHWSTESLKKQQIGEFLSKALDVRISAFRKAYAMANQSLVQYRREIRARGQALLQALNPDEFAVVLACRPYHLDPLVNHGLSRHFSSLGIPVLTMESLDTTLASDLNEVRLDPVIGYHTRLLETAMTVAEDPRLELVQVVSFGCGHDAILSDEMTRILRERSGKEPLVLKLDEGDAAGPLRIRIKSFVETIRERRRIHHNSRAKALVRRALEAFPVKFTAKDKETKTIYVPNLSPAFSRCLSSILSASGYDVSPLPLADQRAIELGKKFVHNDICFPAQVNVGEFLRGLEDGTINHRQAALGIAKNCESCRARQYPVLARKALDDAGYPHIPILTTGKDRKGMHPGFRYTMSQQVRTLWGLTIIDALERMQRRIRPYEAVPGTTANVFKESLDAVCHLVPHTPIGARRILKKAIHGFNAIELLEIPRKPRVGIVGEILMNYHPSANGFIESYLEDHGMEVVLPNLHDFFRKGAFVTREMAKKRWTPAPFLDFMTHDLVGRVYDVVRRFVDGIMKDFALDDLEGGVWEMAKSVQGLVDLTYRTGESWKIPGEIIEMAKQGVQSFVIVQPFGCLPNHITGRGLTKVLKKRLPGVQILSLDYDPDVSRANIENRLQMLIINAKEIRVL